MKAAKARKDDVFQRAQNMSQGDLEWHEPCYKGYTSKTNVGYHTNVEENVPPIGNKPRGCLTETSNSKCCVICGKMQTRKQTRLRTVSGGDVL